MNIQDLPIEIQNKIFYYYAEHPCARMIKEVYNYKLFKVVDYDVDEDGQITLQEMTIQTNYFRIGKYKNIVLFQNHSREMYWDYLIAKIKRRRTYRELLGNHFQE
jgi:hypothetical protein